MRVDLSDDPFIVVTLIFPRPIQVLNVSFIIIFVAPLTYQQLASLQKIVLYPVGAFSSSVGSETDPSTPRIRIPLFFLSIRLYSCVIVFLDNSDEISILSGAQAVNEL